MIFERLILPRLRNFSIRETIHPDIIMINANIQYDDGDQIILTEIVANLNKAGIQRVLAFVLQ